MRVGAVPEPGAGVVLAVRRQNEGFWEQDKQVGGVLLIVFVCGVL